MATLDISKTPLVRLYRVEEARDAILRLGAKKFGGIAPDVEAAVRAIGDLPRLHDLQSRLLEVSNWQELLAEAP